MSIECHIGEDIADFSIEVTTEDQIYDKEKDTWKRGGTTRLAYIAGFRDYEKTEIQQVSRLIRISEELKKFYSTYPDGEVEIKITIKDQMINL